VRELIEGKKIAAPEASDSKWLLATVYAFGFRFLRTSNALLQLSSALILRLLVLISGQALLIFVRRPGSSLLSATDDVGV